MECHKCGKEFTDSKHPDRKYCSKRCCWDVKIKLTPRKCPGCEIEFQPKFRNQVFCKSTCANANHPRKYNFTTEQEIEIVNELLNTDATVASVSERFGCSPSTIKLIYHKHAPKKLRVELARKKQGNAIRGRPTKPEVAEQRRVRMQGENNPFYGRKHRPETIEHLSLRKKGKSPSMAIRIALSAYHQGVALNEWTGFITSENNLVRRRQAYADWRSAVFARDDFTCALCEKRGGRLNAHHIKKFATNPHLRHVIDNGITLCVDCHNQIKGKEERYEAHFADLVQNKAAE